MGVINQVTVFSSDHFSKTYDLEQFHKSSVCFGRGPVRGDDHTPNDIQIPEPLRFVSRAHCTFFRDQDGQWFIQDDHSTNGLYYKDQKITRMQLNDGDKLVIPNMNGEQLVIQFARKAESVQQPGVSSSTFPLQKMSRCVIGRAKDCDIVISHPTASRQHCIITYENGKYYVSDNNSLNGVLLNSRPLVRKEKLKPNDRIAIANVTLVFNNESLTVQKLIGGVSVKTEWLCRSVGRGKKKKMILNNVNLSIRPNEFVAIIGGSGAGKTTLLNCLSGITGFSSGQVLINGTSISTGEKGLRSLMGYVPQQDIVYDSLTLERMLLYSAKLRMPQDTSMEEIREKIDETLRTVELSEHKDTLISKLSGGQRKRASIAVELLASPKLFFLDEPSSGLDPGTEKHLMQMLKRLSQSGKTIIMVTHTVQNLDLCDRVICMGKGGILCYSGSPQNALSFFGKEKMTDIYDDMNDSARFGMTAEETVYEAASGKTAETPRKPAKGLRMLFREFRVMTLRYMEILVNHPMRLLLLLLMPVFLALLVCIAFQADGSIYNVLLEWTEKAKTNDSFYYLLFRKFPFSVDRANYPFLVATDTMSLLFAFSCAVFWTGIFNSIQEVSKERPIYEREKFSGVSVLPYVLSKLVPLTLLCLLQSAIMTAILSVMTNTAATWNGDLDSVTALKFSMSTTGVVFGSMWLETFLTVFLCMLSAMCLGLLISSLVSNEMALVLCPVALMPQILFSGVVGTLSGITETLSNIISCRWSCLAFFVSAQVNSLYKSCKFENGWTLTSFSDDGGLPLLDAAYETTTDYVLRFNGVISGWLVLALISILCVVGAVVILRFRRSQTR